MVDTEGTCVAGGLRVIISFSRMASNQSPLTFRFSLDKFTNALAYFAWKGVKDLTKLKAVKLLYLADRYHLLRYGRPVVGDRYIAMDLGPVPEDAFQLISRLIEPAEVDDPERAQALERLEVYRGFMRRYSYPVLRARSAPDLSVFSESDLEALDATLKEYGSKPARSLVDLTHEHRAYKRANAGRVPGSSTELPYEFFFEDAPEASHVRVLAEQEQEDRDFAEWLQRAGRSALRSKTQPTR
jgi:uncharacterized phage-associated protein